MTKTLETTTGERSEAGTKVRIVEATITKKLTVYMCKELHITQTNEVIGVCHCGSPLEDIGYLETID